MSAPAPPPRFAPDRDPALRTEGGEVAALARALGKPFMPHQQLIADIAGERLPDGGYKYRHVVVTLPRQSGKTTMLGPVQLHRLITKPGYRAFFTAQTGVKAKSRFMDLVTLIRESPLASYFGVRLAQGSESINVGNGSSLRLFPPAEDALHGETPHLVTLDEIWAHSEVKGHQLMGAIGPAQSTLGAEAQVWMVSTMGTADSGMLNEWIERGRAGEPGVAYFDWSLAPGLDPYDRRNWSFHPALGHTVTLDALAAEARAQPPGTWERAYMNRMTAARESLVDPLVLAGLADPSISGRRSETVLAYDVAADRSCAAVIAAWQLPGDVIALRTVHSAPGVSWLAPTITRLAETWQPIAITADDGGPTRAVTDDLTRDGLTIEQLGLRELATGTDALLDRIATGTLAYDGSAAITDGLARAATQPAGDGRRLSRKHSAGPIPGPIAAVAAMWTLTHRPTLSKATYR